MGLAAGLCGLGQGKAAASACEGVARNPGARPAIQLFVILALIFIESLTLYALAMVYIKIH
jgi:F-type H+-transporting ATPase subunit c